MGFGNFLKNLSDNKILKNSKLTALDIAKTLILVASRHAKYLGKNSCTGYEYALYAIGGRPGWNTNSNLDIFYKGHYTGYSITVETDIEDIVELVVENELTNSMIEIGLINLDITQFAIDEAKNAAKKYIIENRNILNYKSILSNRQDFKTLNAEEIKQIFEICGVYLEKDGLFYNMHGELVSGIREGYNNIGNKIAEISFLNGKQNGFMKFWYPNGMKWLEMEFVFNIPQGLRTLWTESGEKDIETIFDSGKAVKKKMYLTNRTLKFFVQLYRERIKNLNKNYSNKKELYQLIYSVLDREYERINNIANNSTGENRLQNLAFANLINENKDFIVDYIYSSIVSS